MKTGTIKGTNQKAQNLLDDIRPNGLFNGKVLFPEKLANANEFIAKHPLPEQLQKQKVQSTCV